MSRREVQRILREAERVDAYRRGYGRGFAAGRREERERRARAVLPAMTASARAYDRLQRAVLAPFNEKRALSAGRGK